jgi:hypothetical protein
MFKNMLLNSIFNALRLYVGTNPFDRIGFVIESLINDPRTGAEKRDYVVSFAKEEFKFLSGAVIRAIIEIYLLVKVPSVVSK